jgi:hypothetical protein
MKLYLAFLETLDPSQFNVPVPEILSSNDVSRSDVSLLIIKSLPSIFAETIKTVASDHVEAIRKLSETLSGLLFKYSSISMA